MGWTWMGEISLRKKLSLKVQVETKMVIAVVIVALIGIVVLVEDQEMTAKSGLFWSLRTSWYRKLPFGVERIFLIAAQLEVLLLLAGTKVPSVASLLYSSLGGQICLISLLMCKLWLKDSTI